MFNKNSVDYDFDRLNIIDENHEFEDMYIVDKHKNYVSTFEDLDLITPE